MSVVVLVIGCVCPVPLSLSKQALKGDNKQTVENEFWIKFSVVPVTSCQTDFQRVAALNSSIKKANDGTSSTNKSSYAGSQAVYWQMVKTSCWHVNSFIFA